MTFFKRVDYTDKASTPLKWHNFTRYVRVPLGALYGLYFIFTLLSVGVNELTVCISLMYGIMVALTIVYLVGSFNWRSYAWKAIIAYEFYSVFVEFCLGALTSNSTSGMIGRLVGRASFSAIEYIYFRNRKLLFNDNKKPETAPQDMTYREVMPTIDTYKNVMYCRKCGTKLEGDALFCRKCGTKVITGD